MASNIDLWKARLLPASFRGIPFFIESHQLNGGRNAKQHEPPDSDQSSTEDISKRSKTFKIDGHVVGDNYFFIRDALIDAMENGDSGILVHPYLGVKEVQPGNYSISERIDEGRIAHFSLEFSETGKKSFPLSALDTALKFVTDVVATVAVVQNAFQLGYKVAQLPSFAKLSTQAIAKDFTKSVRANTAGVSGKGSESSQLNNKLDSFDANVSSLVENPASLVAELDNILTLVRDLPDDPPDSSTIDIVSGRDEKLTPLLNLASFDSLASEIEPLTPTRAQEKANADALISAIRQISTIRLAENVLEKDFTSQDEAIGVRDQLIDLLENQISGDIDDELFKSLSQFKANAVDAIPNGTLNAIETIKVNYTVPAIVLTYDLYELPDREDEIISRNKIENPSFVSGEVEVLRVG